MLTTILTLIGGSLGGVLRLAPEVIKFFNDKADRQHEKDMTTLQADLDDRRATRQIDLAYAQGDIAVDTRNMDAFVAAIESQGKPTGIRWVDALNASVRPIITYWWMSLITLVKLVLIVAAAIEMWLAIKAAGFALEFMAPALTTFSDRVWTPQDAGILSMILTFWFVDRAIRKNSGR